ncbi:RlpA-like double-psi beta-barrel-protein domain-containing protein-containing protein [Auriculariales sp. MPI-PUGE-AT-0066]|nr:RlpA-like double-psi beta-barrel-protein domain-containing protein-containing protein [Auriculariales sp. MPI-PUGE-AT-0066]
MFFQVVLAAISISAVHAQSGSGKTTRYWDCCKPSCGWSGKADVLQPVQSCDAGGGKLTDPNAASGCGGGSAFTCVDNQPWAVDDNLAYGFAAVHISGSTESAWCCECYELTFTNGAAAGKRMIVQATNTGGDLGENHFDLLIPGGGVGLFNGCPAQFGYWNGGETYGGVGSRSDCDGLPDAVRAGCYWRFDWFGNSDNPTMEFKKTTCPAELVQKSGCMRTDSSGPAPAPQPAPEPSPAPPSDPNPPQPTGGSGPTQSLYGQCGGDGWGGPWECQSGSSCVYGNPWYSQCL